jgi:PKD repeat protein
MNIALSTDSGVSPFEVLFEVEFALEEPVVSIVRWLWNFGDGSQSTERSPRHIYQAPGLYTVSCEVVDEFGNEYSLVAEDYIYVYDTTIGESGILSGLTDFCFRTAVKPSQGTGVMPTGGSGWVWPPLLAGAAKCINESNDTITVVIDAETMQIFRIGVPELWTDKSGTYDEAEIECEAMLPEISSRYGPHENVRHIETHVAMRPYDEKDYRGRDGFDSDGFKNGNELSLEIYRGGEQITPATKLESVNRDGDYAFLKDIETKRFQIKLKHSTSAFRVTSIGVHAQEIDHRTPPQLNYIPEKAWQREFSIMDLWLSRKTIGTNRADGIVWQGSHVVAAGPDGKSSSAFLSTGYTGQLGYTTSDFTISGWMIGDGVIFSGQVAGSGSVEMLVAGGILIFDDGTINVQYLLSETTDWRHVVIIRRGSLIEVYEGGYMRLSQAVSVRSYGGNCTVGNGTCFDIRRLSRAVSADAVRYYNESVIAGGGGFLP